MMSTYTLVTCKLKILLEQFLRTLLVSTLFAHVGTSLAQSECQWPMHASINYPGENNDFPINVFFTFEKASDGIISITEKTHVDLSKLTKNFSSIVQASNGWKDMQSRLSCQNRAGEYEFNLIESGGQLQASFGTAVEKFWCSSADVPCPTFSEPFRFCRKEANGKVWGARVKTTAHFAIRNTNNRPLAELVSIGSSTNTSNEQNFVRDIVSTISPGHLFGITAKTFETAALNKIKEGMEDGFRSADFRLPDGQKVPVIPNYDPELIDSRFITTSGANGAFIAVQVIRKQNEFRENTGCFVAKDMKAVFIRPGSRGVVRGGPGSSSRGAVRGGPLGVDGIGAPRPSGR